MTPVRRGCDVGKMFSEDFIQSILSGARETDVPVHGSNSAWAGKVGWEIAVRGVTVTTAARAWAMMGRSGVLLVRRAGHEIGCICMLAGEVEGVRGCRVEIGVQLALSASAREVSKRTTG